VSVEIDHDGPVFRKDLFDQLDIHVFMLQALFLAAVLKDKTRVFKKFLNVPDCRPFVLTCKGEWYFEILALKQVKVQPVVKGRLEDWHKDNTICTVTDQSLYDFQSLCLQQ